MRRARQVGRRRLGRRRYPVARRASLGVVLLGLVAGSIVFLTSGESPLASTPTPTPDPVVVTNVTSDSLSLRWGSMPRAAGYAVQVATNPAMSGMITKTFDQTIGTLDGLEQDTRYWIRIDSKGSSVDVPSGTVSARTEAIGAPSWVGEPKAGDTSVELDWSDVVGADSYIVEVADDDTFDTARSILVDTSETTVTDLTSAHTYWFRVAVADTTTKSALGPWATPALSVKTVDNALRVGTFNIYGVHNDRKSSSSAPWRQRRPAVVSQIHDADLDVVGLQEASAVDSRLYARNLVNGSSQFKDLVNGLRDAGGDWKSTSNSRSTSNDTRIAYRADRLELVDQGGRKFSAQVNENERYLAWAIFTITSTGREVLFVTTHLTPRSQGVRERQWRELISFTASTAGDRPVIVGGDFNSSKFHMPAGRMLPAMESAGFGDVLGQRYRSPSNARVRAEKAINANIGSFNGLKRRPGSYGPSGIGNSVDYLFASNALVVRQFELVGNFSPAGTIQGTIPSDHFLLTAVVEIP